MKSTSIPGCGTVPFVENQCFNRAKAEVNGSFWNHTLRVLTPRLPGALVINAQRLEKVKLSKHSQVVLRPTPDLVLPSLEGEARRVILELRDSFRDIQ